MSSTHTSSLESPGLEQRLVNKVHHGFLQDLKARAGVKAIPVTGRGGP
jgi:hypothetical protein